MVKLRNYGIIVSLILHISVLAIPFSISISNYFKEIELFVIDETTLTHGKTESKKDLIKTEKNIIRPTAPTGKKEEIEPKQIEPMIKNEEKTIISVTQNAEKTLKEKNDTPIVKVYEGEFGSSQGPKFLHRQMPVYPLMARRLAKEGRVLLRLSIDEEGNLMKVEVLEGACCGFTESAIEAVKKSTFIPAKIDGKPVPSRALLSIRFNLRD